MTFTIAAPGAPRPRTRKRKIPLAPVNPTRTGAVTRDGEWAMERLDDDGSTWTVAHRETKTVVADFLGSLRQCREYVGSGEAQADLERLLAHGRGEHDGKPAGQCPECLNKKAA